MPKEKKEIDYGKLVSEIRSLEEEKKLLFEQAWRIITEKYHLNEKQGLILSLKYEETVANVSSTGFSEDENK